jgi:hypothetical protein
LQQLHRIGVKTDHAGHTAESRVCKLELAIVAYG